MNKLLGGLLLMGMSLVAYSTQPPDGLVMLSLSTGDRSISALSSPMQTLFQSCDIVLTILGDSKRVTIKNLSATEIVYNVDAIFPTGWDNVEIDSTNCRFLPPISSCELEFRATGMPQHPRTEIFVLGFDSSGNPNTTRPSFYITVN
jgi:hypothetical protein